MRVAAAFTEQIQVLVGKLMTTSQQSDEFILVLSSFQLIRLINLQLLTDVVDGAVIAAQDKEGAGGVVAADGNHILVLQRSQRTCVKQTDNHLKQTWSNQLPRQVFRLQHFH